MRHGKPGKVKEVRQLPVAAEPVAFGQVTQYADSLRRREIRGSHPFANVIGGGTSPKAGTSQQVQRGLVVNSAHLYEESARQMLFTRKLLRQELSWQPDRRPSLPILSENATERHPRRYPARLFFVN